VRLVAAVLLAAGAVAAPASAERQHGIAMHGRPALPPGFEHFPYADPKAPKGGTLHLGHIGSFDSLNPLIIKGVAANGVREWVYESLLARSLDEPFSLYGLIAEAVEMPDDRRSITFHINAAASFSDGRPVTADDVVFSWKLLRERGQPYHRLNYASVVKAEAQGPGIARFEFADDGNREAPLLIGLMPVLPRHRIDPETFERTSFEPPVGSGPYVVAAVEPGRSVLFRRNPDWWGRELPVNRGRFNFAEIRNEYFRDQGSLFEAFKVGDVHVRAEDDAGRWIEGYGFSAVTEGRIRRREIATGLPAGMSALVFNTRRPVFADVRVRQALIQLLDFEWINRNFYHGVYARTQSFFERSELSSHLRPADDRERALLAPHIKRIKPEILAGTHAFPRTDGSGQNRQSLQAAFALLKAAGYAQDGGRLVEVRSRQPLAFEMMASTKSEERLFQAYAQVLQRLGIEARVRIIDSTQRWTRMKAFDFDMIQWTWVASLSPGNEQMNRWSVESAGTELSLNFAGVRDPAVNQLIEALLAARDRPEFVSAARALDRLLLSGDYVIPLHHARTQWIAHWSQVAGPPKPPLWGFVLDTWWMSPAP
jgi:peptide/nickel transport system substrate-binding protein